MQTYCAMQASAVGKLELVTRPLIEPPPGSVRIRVEACGVCHSDVLAVEGVGAGLTFPRVPGHEVVGRIDAIGEAVDRWRPGQRVGVGWHGGYCGKCDPCRRGKFFACVTGPPVTGISHDGGYGEYMIAPVTSLARVPDGLSATDAAPLMCAGVTTFNALRNSGARSGDLVAVHGLGGLGHLGVQFARHMGFRVAAIARGADKAPLAAQLGAHHYIDSGAEDPAAALQTLGGASVILTTVPSGKAMSPMIGGLKAKGRMVVVGVGTDPIEADTAQLTFGTRGLQGSLTGSPIDEEDTLAFSVLQNIRPMIETMKLEQAAEAYGRMMRGDARFRMVLVMGQ